MKTPPTKSTCACLCLISPSYLFYDPQGLLGGSSNHVLHHGHPDFGLQSTSSLSLSPVCLHFVQRYTRVTQGEKIHCHLFLSSTELRLWAADLSFHLDDCVVREEDGGGMAQHSSLPQPPPPGPHHTKMPCDSLESILRRCYRKNLHRLK